MKNAFLITIIVALLTSALPIALQAQNDEAKVNYHVVEYMKVAPENVADYLVLEQAWKKIHQANIKAGKLLLWELTQVLSPIGDHHEYNYITRHLFAGEKQMAAFYDPSYFPENWESLLTKEEVALVNRTSSLRTYVKQEIWMSLEGTFAEDIDKATIQVVNFFSRPEGVSREDHITIERNIWKPFHQARIDAGAMKGWGMFGLLLPMGADMPYQEATVDLYLDMPQLFKEHFGLNPFDYGRKVHGENAQLLYEHTLNSIVLSKAEVRRVIDAVAAN